MDHVELITSDKLVIQSISDKNDVIEFYGVKYLCVNFMYNSNTKKMKAILVNEQEYIKELDKIEALNENN